MKHSDYHGKLLRLAMVFVALFLCGTMAYAQTDLMISGIVVDENGEPLLEEDSYTDDDYSFEDSADDEF